MTLTSHVRISLITVNFNTTTATLDLLRSAVDMTDTEFIVVDNGSSENPEKQIISEFPQVKFIRSPKNLGFAGGNNLGIDIAEGQYLLFLNNDTEIDSTTITCLADYLDTHKEVAGVSPKICFFDAPQIIQFSGYTALSSITGRNKTLGEGQLDSGQWNKTAPTAYLHGAAMMIRRRVVSEVGKLPEAYFLYYEELDWSESFKKQNYTLYYLPCTTVLHKDSLSSKDSPAKKTYYIYRNRYLFMRRHRKPAQLVPFVAYYTLLALPIHSIKFILSGKASHAKAAWKGFFWNFSNPAK